MRAGKINDENLSLPKVVWSYVLDRYFEWYITFNKATR